MKPAVTLLFALLLGGSLLRADSRGGNILFAERTDQQASCVLNGDRVTLQIYGPLVKPEGDWLAKGKSGGIIANITVQSDSDQPVSHSVVKEVEFQQDDRQQDFVRLPMTMLVTNQLVIAKTGQPTITAISLSIKYIGKKTPTAWGAGLQTMASLVNILPLPPGPYQAGAKALATFSTNLVQKSLQVDNPDTKDAKVDMDIPLSGRTNAGSNRRCMGNLEIGAYALADAWPTTGDDNFVNVDRPTDYCMKAEPGGSASNVTFWFQKRQSTTSDGSCTAVPGSDLHVLGNPHVPVLITATSDSDQHTKAAKGEAGLPIGISIRQGKAVAEPLASYSASTKASLALCHRLRIPTAQCFGEITSSDQKKRDLIKEFTSKELLQFQK